MDLATLVRGAILLSMMLLVVALGMRSAAGDALHLLHRPRLLVRSLIAMNVAMPLLIFFLVSLFDLRPAVKIALLALAISPVPPFLPDKQLKLEYNRSYVYALFVTASLVSVVLVPLTMQRVASFISIGEPVGSGKVFSIVAMTVLGPLAIGAAVRRLWPNAAARLNPFLSKAGTLLLLLAFSAVLLSQWPVMWELIGDGTLLAIVTFTGLGLGVGHYLGGPDPNDRGVLALATASRHPAVALAVAAASFPDQPQVPAVLLLALIVGMLAPIPYTAWRKRMR